MRTLVAVTLLTIMIGGCASAAAPRISAEHTPDAVSTEMLKNCEIVDSNGVPLKPVNSLVVGPVDGLIVDAQSGETLYALVRLEDIYNFGKGAWRDPQDKYLPIPWSHLRVLSGRQLKIDVDVDVLAEAPSFAEPPDTAVPSWDEAIQRFWAEK